MIRGTSLAAKRSITAGTTKTLRRTVFDFILKRGVVGATLAEIVADLDMPIQTATPRRHELGEKGLVIDSGTRRMTPSGRTAIVWIVPSKISGRAYERGF